MMIRFLAGCFSTSSSQTLRTCSVESVCPRMPIFCLPVGSVRSGTELQFGLNTSTLHLREDSSFKYGRIVPVCSDWLMQSDLAHCPAWMKEARRKVRNGGG